MCFALRPVRERYVTRPARPAKDAIDCCPAGRPRENDCDGSIPQLAACPPGVQVVRESWYGACALGCGAGRSASRRRSGRFAGGHSPRARSTSRCRTLSANGKDDPRGRITIRQFLTMSSGLAGLDQTRDGGPLSPIVQLTDGAEVYKAAFAFPKVAEPGMDFGLNQVDSKILGRIVERATGRPFADYLCEKLWRKIGAGTATLNVDAMGRSRTLRCTRSALSDWPHIWLGWKPDTPEVKSGGRIPLQMPTKRPCLVDDIAYLMGGGFMTVWISPSQDPVELRWGVRALEGPGLGQLGNPEFPAGRPAEEIAAPPFNPRAVPSLPRVPARAPRPAAAPSPDTGSRTIPAGRSPCAACAARAVSACRCRWPPRHRRRPC